MIAPAWVVVSAVVVAVVVRVARHVDVESVFGSGIPESGYLSVNPHVLVRLLSIYQIKYVHANWFQSDGLVGVELKILRINLSTKATLAWHS